jgi:nitrogen fixation NifU-like protein
MSDIQQLYQKIIVEHANHPYGAGELLDYDVQAKLSNPDCGDRFEVSVKFNQNQIVAIGFTGEGCMISQASASMMVMMLNEKSITEARKLMQNFQNLVLQKTYDSTQLGDLIAFKTLHQFPTRVRCGMLAWHALAECLAKGAEEFDGNNG